MKMSELMMRKKIGLMLVSFTAILICVFAWAYLMRSTPYARLSTKRSAGGEAFPSLINGIHVKWVPDENIRKLGKEIPPDDVSEIVFYGSGNTGVPGQLTVRDRRAISLLLQGLACALKLKYDSSSAHLLQDGAMCMRADNMTISLRPHSRSWKQYSDKPLIVGFYADIYEGTFPAMYGGTVSPEFQYAMRYVGIEKVTGKPSVLYRLKTMMMH